MANLKDVIYLSNADYDILISTGTVTIDGTTLTYNADSVYITPDIIATNDAPGLMSAADKTKLNSLEALPTKVNDRYLHTNASTGQLEWSTGGSGTVTDVQVNSTSILSGTIANLVTNTAYNASSNKIATMSDVIYVEANPTLAGTEGDLSSLQVGNTKYKVRQGLNEDDLPKKSFELYNEVSSSQLTFADISDVWKKAFKDNSFVWYPLETSDYYGWFAEAGTDIIYVLIELDDDAHPTALDYQYAEIVNIRTIPNPTLAGTEDYLTGLQSGYTKYKVLDPTRVNAKVISYEDALAILTSNAVLMPEGTEVTGNRLDTPDGVAVTDNTLNL